MESTLRFFDEFLESEYRSTAGIFSKDVSDDECRMLTDRTKSFLHSSVKYQHERSGAEFDADMAEFSEMNRANAVKRQVFLVKERQNPTYGDALRRVTTGDRVYELCCSYHMKARRGVGYSVAFFVSETNEGLKIVYLRRFLSGKWSEMHGYAPMQIIDAGRVVECRKLQAPEDPESLALYDSE
ncbi:hypothetical protein AKJ09_05618 [Labilithrix luteola]|uniref:Uncharacterized protein n=1 Tax=Labilithrix luteola TaxID=1391654 RepID=A0A0K1Q0L6_9BACT|nr:hypothetical protein [Labilithrix luteola]AKU98954.1 hypothetical protein AKJ09_05618 [Labilithrix luteola]